MSTKIAHNSGRRKATDRQQPRRGKRPRAAHGDKYANKQDAATLAELREHFNSEERVNERR